MSKCYLSQVNVVLVDLYVILGNKTTSSFSHFNDFAKQLMASVALVTMNKFFFGQLTFLLTIIGSRLALSQALIGRIFQVWISILDEGIFGSQELILDKLQNFHDWRLCRSGRCRNLTTFAFQNNPSWF